MKDKRFLTIFLIVFIDLLGFGLILPLLPFIAENFAANAFQIGLLTATYSFFQFIASPILGRLSDRYGRKKLLFISQIGSAIGFVILGVANALPALFLSRIIDGITGGNISIAQAYIADITTKEDRTKGMGIIGAAFGLGFALGPAIGGTLSNISFSTPAYFAAVVALIAAIATALFLEETVKVEKTSKSKSTQFSVNELKKVLTAKPVGLLIITFFLVNFAFAGMQGIFALWAERTLGLGPSTIGYLFAFVGIVAIISQLQILPRVVKKFGDRSTLIYSIPFLILGFIMIPFSLHIGIVLIALTLIVVGNALSNPTIQSIASKNVEDDDYGGTLGILHSSASLGRIFGPMLGGFLFLQFGKEVPFFTSAIILLVTFILLNNFLKDNQTLFKRLKTKIVG